VTPRRSALTLALLAVAAPAAAALPGDPGFQVVSPAADAVVDAAPDGLRVTFTCPAYRTLDDGQGFVVQAGAPSYRAILATVPDLGSDGLLRADAVLLRVTADTPNTVPAGECVSVLGDGRATGPQNTPGTYWYQVYRLCTGCATGYEAGEVRRVVVRSAGTLRLRPAVAFAGYPARFTVAAPGIPDGVRVQLQRQAGAVWGTIATGFTVGGSAEVFANLRRGGNRLRVVAVVGADVVASPVTSVTGRVAARRATSAADDGRYTGPRGVTLRIRKGGTVITAATIRVLMVCPAVPAPGGIGGQVTTQTGFAQITSAPIAPDGRFVAAGTSQGSSVAIHGRLRKGRVIAGVARLSVGACSGRASFTAARLR
jgi:hypothetical protein